jgi:hypothetical protein
MATKSKTSRASHDRSALIQWMALAVFAALALLAAFILFDGNDGGTHSGAPVVSAATA